jgi:hypothetical protein
MQFLEIPSTRLASQHITSAKFHTAKGLVGWMGAMQAQDEGMAKWAVGVRLPGSTLADIQQALDAGEIFRTHVLRPTWHLVSAGDIHWMLALSAPRLKTVLKSRHAGLGLTDAVVAKSCHLIESALRDGRHLKRAELVAVLDQAGIATNENRASHLFFCAEIEGIVCSGPERDGKPTYALLPERAPEKRSLSKEEALAYLANIYFTSRCPATLQDFRWWSGQTTQDARQALDLVKSNFVSETIGNKTYWLDPSAEHPPVSALDTLHLLPAYDEFMISYQDREASLQQADSPRMISSNGIFRPVIVLDGQVIGIWRRKTEKKTVLVEVELFKPADQTIIHRIQEEAVRHAHFLGLETGSVSGV